MNPTTLGDVNVAVAWLENQIDDIQEHVAFQERVRGFRNDAAALLPEVLTRWQAIPYLLALTWGLIRLTWRNHTMKRKILAQFQRNCSKIDENVSLLKQYYPDDENTARLAKAIEAYKQRINNLKKGSSHV